MPDSHARHETFFKALVENAFELITVLDREGRVIYENPSNAKFVGYGPDEILGRNVFALIHPDDLARVQAIFVSLLATPKQLPVTVFRLKHKDGTWRWIESLGNNLLHDPAVGGIVINSRDVTERVNADARIKELNDLRKKFIGIVSHQLRTPLASIRWNLETLIADEDGKISHEAAEYARNAHAADVEIIKRIDDMLSAIDIEEGRVVLRRAKASLAEIGGTVLEDLRKRCEAKGIAFSYIGPKGELPELMVDEDKIRSVFRNLADNAVSYTQAGGRVIVTVAEKAHRVHFEVRDTGVGIPEKEQERIFTRFYRASNAPTMKPDADGVGLSVAKYYVEQHGGTIGFTSEPGEGSTFWFDLPL